MFTQGEMFNELMGNRCTCTYTRSSVLSQQYLTTDLHSTCIQLPALDLLPSPLAVTALLKRRVTLIWKLPIYLKKQDLKTSNSASIKMECSLKCSHTFAEYCMHHFREVSLEDYHLPHVSYFSSC